MEAGEVADVVAGEAGPGVQGAGERVRGAVVHVAAAVGDDELVLGVEGAAFAGEGEDDGGGAFAEPVPVREAGAGCQAVRGVGVVSGEPVVEQAEADADAGGDVSMSCMCCATRWVRAALTAATTCPATPTDGWSLLTSGSAMARSACTRGIPSLRTR